MPRRPGALTWASEDEVVGGGLDAAGEGEAEVGAAVAVEVGGGEARPGREALAEGEPLVAGPGPIGVDAAEVDPVLAGLEAEDAVAAGVAGGGEDEGVGALAADQRVASRPADQGVVAAAAGQPVGAARRR